MKERCGRCHNCTLPCVCRLGPAECNCRGECFPEEVKLEMNESDRKKLDQQTARLLDQWMTGEQYLGHNEDDCIAFAYWLVNRSGWRVLSPEVARVELGIQEGVARHRRDLFAAAALQGFISGIISQKIPGPNGNYILTKEGVASESVSFADALIAELDKSKP